MAFELTNPYTNQKSLSDYMLENAKARYVNNTADAASIANQSAAAALPYAGSNAQQANQQTQLQTQAQQLQAAKVKNDMVINELSQDHDANSWELGKQRLMAAGIDTSNVGPFDPTTQQQYLQKAVGTDKIISTQLDVFGNQLKAYMSTPQAAGSSGPAAPPLLSAIMGVGGDNTATQAPAAPIASPVVSPTASEAPKPLSSYMAMPPAKDPGAEAPNAVDVPTDTPTPVGPITGAIDANESRIPISTPQPSPNGYAQVQKAAAKAGIPAPAVNSTLLASNQPINLSMPVLKAPVDRPLSVGGKPMVEGAETGAQWYRGPDGSTIQKLAPGVAVFNPDTPKDLHGDAYLATLAPEKRTYVSDIANYSQPIMNTRTASSGLALEDITAAVKQANPNWKQGGYDVMQSFLTPDKTGASQIQNLNTVGPHLQLYAKAAKALDNGDMQLLNSVRAEYLQQTGSALPTNLEAIGTLAANEIQKASLGAPGGQGDREDVKEPLLPHKSGKQLAGAIEQYTDLIKARAKASEQTYKNGTGNNDFYNLLLPNAQKLYDVVPTFKSPNDPDFKNLKPERYFRDSSGKLMVKH